MEKPSKSIRELAGLLVAAEAAARVTSGGEPVTLSVCDKLRLSLTRFCGVDAFSALIRRSLALSRTEIPALNNVTVGPSGCLEGLELVTEDNGVDPGTVITANLLWLLVTFMGEPITMRLVKDAWPDLPFGEQQEGDENVYEY